MVRHLILGTAGHIDHGKTALITALTGVDTDRLPEEKERGITIDLGFAELAVGDYRLGIVDVPGHERFVRNMLAGATGMDLALLVVAADDSVKPQTREHLEILRLLDLPAGVIAITKCDLAEPDWIELVIEEVRELTAGTFLEQAPVVRTSVRSGQGLDELREALHEAARQSAAARPMHPELPFRMPIDRAFTIAGHGTVVTGSVASGAVSVGDELVVEPGGHRVRVRGLQSHDQSVERLQRGQRAAVNLAGLHHAEVRRGHELAAIGHLSSSRILSCQLRLLPAAPRPLKHRGRVRLHLGTAEIMARVRLLNAEQVAPGQQALAQLFLAEPVAAAWNQPLVIRSESPVETIGGGHVLDPAAEPLRRPADVDLQMLGQLADDDPLRRAAAAVFFVGQRPWQPSDLYRLAGVEHYDDVVGQLRQQGQLIEVPLSPTRQLLLHSRWLDRQGQRVQRALAAMHDHNALRSEFDSGQLDAHFRDLPAPLVSQVLQRLQQQKLVRVSPRGVALVGRGPKLSANERKLLGELVQWYREAGLQAPSVTECQKRATRNQQSVPQLIALAEANGDLVSVTSDYYLHADVEQQLRDQLTEALEENPSGLTVSQIRELLNTSRKYALPLCEYFDRIGFTERRGDLRVRKDAGPA